VPQFRPGVEEVALVRRALVLLVIAGVLIPAVPAVGVPGESAGAVPVVGECYSLTDVEAAGDYWVESEPVPCTQVHTYEVTNAALVPMDVDAVAFARERCGSLDVWTALGINSSTAGIIADPIRIEPRAFFARPEHFVCGAVAVAYQGRAPATLVPLATSIERLRARDRSSLRHCADAADGRSALAPAVTVPCSSRPRWQTTSWILWSALYDDNPGRATLRARAAQLCGVGATFSLPAAASWREGFPRTWCYRKYA
jgi:hypothetical protein